MTKKEISIYIDTPLGLDFDTIRKQVLDLYDDFCLKDMEIISCDLYKGDLRIPILLECREFKKSVRLKVQVLN